jgi:hypothetical protein
MLLPMFTVNDEAVGPHQPGRAAPDDHEQLGGVERAVDYLAISPAARASH